MNIRHIRDLTLKILGIFYLSHALVYAPQLSSLFMSWDKTPEYAGHGPAIALSVLLPLAFWIGLGLVLVFRTSIVVALLWPRPPEDNGSTAAGTPALAFWIVLIGFFYFVGALGGAVAETWILAVNREMRGSFLQFKFLPEFITMILSIVCIVKAKAIAAWLQTKIGEDSQQ